MGRRRSQSIHAKSLEEYMELVINEKIIFEANHEEDELSSKSLREKLGEESNYVGLKKDGEFQKINFETERSAERDLVSKLESLNRAYKSNEMKEDKLESMDLLAAYFKERVSDKKHKDLVLSSSIKFKTGRAMSESAISDINMKEALDFIIRRKEECENEDFVSENNLFVKEKKSNSLFSHDSFSTALSREVLVQNVQYEDTVKVMLVGSTHTGKTKLINNFLECRKNKYIPSNGLEIKKKLVKIFGKTTRVEFFDTDAHFHLQNASKIYYRICDAFLYVLDCLKIDTFDYIQNVHFKIFDNSYAKHFVILALNYSSCDFKTSLFSFTKEYKITFFEVDNVDNFFIKNDAVYNLFSTMVIKKRKTHRKSKFKSKFQLNKKDKEEEYDNLLNEYTSSGNQLSLDNERFGFNDMYRLEEYSNEKEEKLNGHKNKRRWIYYEVY
jgi:hypothetical protein